MELTDAQRERFLEAVRPARALERGVASRILVLDGEVVDAAIDLASGRAWRRPLPERRAEPLATWLELLVRQRGQLAHELSGPATGVLAALETVLEFEPVPESGREILREARAGLIRLAELLVQRDPLQPAASVPVEAPLGGLLERSVGAAARRLDPMGQRLRFEVHAPGGATVSLHLPSLEAILGVLVSNAWRARRRHHVAIRVEGQLDAGTLFVTVRDDGVGMSEEIRQRAGDLGFCGRSNGVGLGLFSVRWALRDQGGLVLDAGPEGTAATVFLRAAHESP